MSRPAAPDPALARFEALFGPEFGQGIDHGLQPLRRALGALGAPHDKLAPIIHVAGTNGKGSTIAFMRTIARAGGLRVHAFTKPHLIQLRERFALNHAPIGSDRLIVAAERVFAAEPSLTQFEAQIAAAFLLFSEAPADLILLETGMGGLNDAANVIERPAISVLTPIALDHHDALGPSLEQIARHKAGIIKPAIPVISARQPATVRDIIAAEAERNSAPLCMQGEHWDAFERGGALIVQDQTGLADYPLPALRGAHQIDNAGLAITALRTWGEQRISASAIAQGVQSAHWPGRLQALTRGPFADRARATGCELWLDGGHNAHAAEALSRWAGDMNTRRPAPLVLIVALRTRKDAEAFLRALTPSASRIYTLSLGAGWFGANDLARRAGVNAQTANTLDDAIARATETHGARILVCGSLELAGRVLAANSG